MLKGDLSETVRVDLATFLAAQIMRDPGTLASYRPQAQEYAVFLLGAVDAKNYASFSADLQMRFPGAEIQEAEFNYIRGLGSLGAGQAVDQILSALDSAGGVPELPFTDLIRNPSGRDIIRDVLLGLDWQLKSDANSGFILGDTALLFERADLGSGLRAPISKTAALYLNPIENPGEGIVSTSARSFEVENLNYESAARTRSWLVGVKVRLETVKSQVIGRGFPET